jgi:MoxR-like ATPase
VKVAAVAERVREVVATLGRIVVGKDDVLERIMAGILANGHVLVEDYPGLAKTLIARLLAQALDLGFRRIQFTPDLLPSDITGSFLYDQREARFEFRAGPVFTNLLLADEINRATPKTQAALLEAMQESQVTIEGQSFPLEQPFVVIATQNPIEMEGTYPLPEAQLDRFLLRVGIGYPDADAEREILKRRRERRTDAATVPTIVTRAELLAMQGALEDVFVSEALERYIVALAQATRVDPRVTLGASPRGSLALLKLARAEAALRGRDFVLPDDVKAVAVAALAHRLEIPAHHHQQEREKGDERGRPRREGPRRPRGPRRFVGRAPALQRQQDDRGQGEQAEQQHPHHVRQPDHHLRAGGARGGGQGADGRGQHEQQAGGDHRARAQPDGHAGANRGRDRHAAADDAAVGRRGQPVAAATAGRSPGFLCASRPDPSGPAHR